MFLTDEELLQLTHRKTFKAQREFLQSVGIRFVVRPDGSNCVSKAHVEIVMGGAMVQNRSDQKRIEPNFAALKSA